jgi:hypothetical protein
VFGPKIGFGFYSNLTGNFEPVTMDMWFMRTVGRLAGTLPAFDPVLFPKQVAKLRAALAEKGPAERGLYADQFGKDMVKAAMKTDEGAIALARAVNSLHNRQFIKERAAFDSGARIKSSLVGASGAILKSADKPTDAPSSGGERQRLRDVVRQMVDMVETGSPRELTRFDMEFVHPGLAPSRLRRFAGSSQPRMQCGGFAQPLEEVVRAGKPMLPYSGTGR